MNMRLTDYRELLQRAEALLDRRDNPISSLANASALVYEALDHVNWAGFYLLEGDRLILGPFQGKVACVSIARGKGVCGKAADLDEPQVVMDVHRFPGHIACDSASNSEIVIPLHKEGRVAGVLDIDSPLFSRFDERDLEGLGAFAAVVEKCL